MTTLAHNAEVLSEQGAEPARTLRADEALPLFAHISRRGTGPHGPADRSG